MVRLNADDLTRDILANDPAAVGANLQAAIATDAAVAECIERGVDLLVETVLSSDKYVDDIERAITLGYRVGVIYVALATPEGAVRRVALRRALGGHDVPTDRVVARWSRSIAMLGRIAPIASRLYVFDNTEPAIEGAPTLIAFKDDGRFVMLHSGRIPAIDDAIKSAPPTR